MHSPKRVIVNTAASYANSLVALFVALFSTRWILQGLGQVDFGLYGAVGSIILLVAFISGTLCFGVSRFYSYSIGQGYSLSKEESVEDLKRWFNTALSIHILIPVLLIGIGWPIGEYAIHHLLTIPSDRIDACSWVFRASLMSAFVSVVSVPFTAMYTAHQRIFELAVFGVLRTGSVFVISWCLLSVSSDRLIFYAICMMGINICIPLLQVIRAVCLFDACRVKVSYMYNSDQLKELFGYVGWKILGATFFTLRSQGTPLLVNLHSGPLVNAAYTLAFSLSTQATSLSTSLTQAFLPAIVTAEGNGDRLKMLSMAMQACKFGALLVLLFTIPLVLEMDNLLELWLKEPPQYTGSLCQWMLSMLVVDRMTSGQMLAVNAYGKMAAYEVVQGITLFLALPLIWVFFHFGYDPVSVGYSLFITMVAYCFVRIIFAKYLLGFPILKWIKQVLLPVTLLLVASTGVGYSVMSALDAGLLRLVLTSASTGIVTFLIGWFHLFNRSERAYAVSGVKKMTSKFI